VTKQDYIALAAALKAQMPTYTGDKHHADYGVHGFVYHQWTCDVRAITEVLANGNPKFSKGKFIAACGIPNILDDGITTEMRKSRHQLSQNRRRLVQPTRA